MQIYRLAGVSVELAEGIKAGAARNRLGVNVDRGRTRTAHRGLGFSISYNLRTGVMGDTEHREQTDRQKNECAK